MALYLATHGETEAVARGLCIGGESTSMLSDRGVTEAITLGGMALEAGISHIGGSVQPAARQTAQIVGSRVGILPLRMQGFTDLEDYGVGSLENTTEPTVDRSRAFREAGAENPYKFAHRIIRTLEHKHRIHELGLGPLMPNPHMLLIAHPAVSRMVETLVTDRSPVDFYDVEPAHPTTIRELDVSQLSQTFQTHYLEALLSNSPA